MGIPKRIAEELGKSCYPFQWDYIDPEILLEVEPGRTNPEWIEDKKLVDHYKKVINNHTYEFAVFIMDFVGLYMNSENRDMNKAPVIDHLFRIFEIEAYCERRITHPSYIYFSGKDSRFAAEFILSLTRLMKTYLIQKKHGKDDFDLTNEVARLLAYLRTDIFTWEFF